MIIIFALHCPVCIISSPNAISVRGSIGFRIARPLMASASILP